MSNEQYDLIINTTLKVMRIQAIQMIHCIDKGDWDTAVNEGIDFEKGAKKVLMETFNIKNCDL